MSWRRAVLIGATLAVAAAVPTRPMGAQDPGPSGRENPIHVSLGKFSRMAVRPTERDRIRKFYGDVLGFKVIELSERVDHILLAPEFELEVVYTDAAAAPADLAKAVWLELSTDHPAALKQRILKFGVRPIADPADPHRFVFQAPGGQVFRLVDSNEGVSKAEMELRDEARRRERSTASRALPVGVKKRRLQAIPTHLETKMTAASEMKPDFRAPTTAKRSPKAAVDGVAGMILAFAELGGTPEQAFRALTTNEVEQWWKFPGMYHQKNWKADLRVGGAWSVAVELADGKEVRAWGEFCELSFPNKIVMTRRFDPHPFLGDRETTITYRFEPSPHGTLVTVRDEGFIGRPQAAYGNAEIWEKVLGWLDGYLSSKAAKG